MMRNLFASALALTSLGLTFSCSNILVTNKASSDGSALLGDNDDTAKRFGAVTHFPAASWPKGSTRDIYDFEQSYYRGSINQPSKTVISILIFNVPYLIRLFHFNVSS